MIWERRRQWGGGGGRNGGVGLGVRGRDIDR